MLSGARRIGRGESPPLSWKPHLKSAPGRANGAGSWMISRGSVVIETGIERVDGKPVASETRIMMVPVFSSPGVPERTPVEASRERPRGRSPVADHL